MRRLVRRRKVAGNGEHRANLSSTKSRVMLLGPSQAQTTKLRAKIRIRVLVSLWWGYVHSHQTCANRDCSVGLVEFDAAMIGMRFDP